MYRMVKAYYHLPGLFEFYELYRVFLPLYREHRDWFYDWCEIGSIYGAPADCIWGGGRAGFGENDPKEVLALMQEYGISARLTFSNSLLKEKHLSDRKCNALCALLEENKDVQNGVIVHSDLLLEYLKKHYPHLYFVSSTTKVITDFKQLVEEIRREDFRYVVPDFRLNKAYDRWKTLSWQEKDKVHPYFSTDTGVVLRAIEVEADVILLAKAIDGVYNADPAKDPTAKKYDEVSIDEVIAKNLQVVDMTASILARDNKMPMWVFGLNEENSIVNTLKGKFNGTKVTV